jgi:hypothetical protein
VSPVDLDDQLAEGMAKIMHSEIERAFTPLRDRIAALETRLADSDTKSVRFCGTWQAVAAADGYARGSLVTYKGALWHANRQTSDRPGESGDWQLAVKAGGAA